MFSSITLECFLGLWTERGNSKYKIRKIKMCAQYLRKDVPMKHKPKNILNEKLRIKIWK